MVGAAGAGASAAAILATRAGALVTACDRSTDSPYVPAVEAAGVTVLEGHDASHVVATEGGVTVARVDRVAVTKALTSIDPGHAELASARAAGIPLEPWQQVVADSAESHGGRLVGVAGTHGKSTSSGWLVELLWRAGRDPSAFVGALLPTAVSGALPSTARWGTGRSSSSRPTSTPATSTRTARRWPCCSTRSGTTPTCSQTRMPCSRRSRRGSAGRTGPASRPR